MNWACGPLRFKCVARTSFLMSLLSIEQRAISSTGLEETRKYANRSLAWWLAGRRNKLGTNMLRDFPLIDVSLLPQPESGPGPFGPAFWLLIARHDAFITDQ